jgi:hypothetical protein
MGMRGSERRVTREAESAYSARSASAHAKRATSSARGGDVSAASSSLSRITMRPVACSQRVGVRPSLPPPPPCVPNLGKKLEPLQSPRVAAFFAARSSQCGSIFCYYLDHNFRPGSQNFRRQQTALSLALRYGRCTSRREDRNKYSHISSLPNYELHWAKPAGHRVTRSGDFFRRLRLSRSLLRNNHSY